MDLDMMIWLGPLFMGLGGVLSLSDRRRRVGAPKPAKSNQTVYRNTPSMALPLGDQDH
jgi:hypothetical protein